MVLVPGTPQSLVVGLQVGLPLGQARQEPEVLAALPAVLVEVVAEQESCFGLPSTAGPPHRGGVDVMVGPAHLSPPASVGRVSGVQSLIGHPTFGPC